MSEQDGPPEPYTEAMAPVHVTPPAGPPPADPPPPAPHRTTETITTSTTTFETWSWLELLALVALLIGLFVKESDVNLWELSEAWSIFAIVCGVAQLAPLARSSFHWTAERAWLIAAVGAGGLALYWLLLELPAIARNTAFAVTVAPAAAIGGVWLAPGRHDPTR